MCCVKPKKEEMTQCSHQKCLWAKSFLFTLPWKNFVRQPDITTLLEAKRAGVAACCQGGRSDDDLAEDQPVDYT